METQSLIITAQELRTLRDQLPGHTLPDEKLILVGNNERICLAKQLPPDNTNTQSPGQLLGWLPRKQ